jgi:hypothetical protein
MREPRDRKIGEHTYTVTPAPARRALRVLPLISRGVFNLSGDEVVLLGQTLLDGLCLVDNTAQLWPMFDAHFAGDMDGMLELLGFAIEVSTGFNRAADGKEKASPSEA